jgi:hypothetical protein
VINKYFFISKNIFIETVTGFMEELTDFVTHWNHIEHKNKFSFRRSLLECRAAVECLHPFLLLVFPPSLASCSSVFFQVFLGRFCLLTPLGVPMQGQLLIRSFWFP